MMPIEDILLLGVIFVGIPTFIVVRKIVAARRDAQELHERVHDAIEKITADGKIEGPKGKYKPKRWGRKWIDYANSLPAPRQHYEMHGREMPTLGRDE